MERNRNFRSCVPNQDDGVHVANFGEHRGSAMNCKQCRPLEEMMTAKTNRCPCSKAAQNYNGEAPDKVRCYEHCRRMEHKIRIIKTGLGSRAQCSRLQDVMFCAVSPTRRLNGLDRRY